MSVELEKRIHGTVPTPGCWRRHFLLAAMGFSPYHLSPSAHMPSCLRRWVCGYGFGVGLRVQVVGSLKNSTATHFLLQSDAVGTSGLRVSGLVSHRVSSSLSGPVVLSLRALSGRLKFTVRCQKFNQDSLPVFGVWGCPLPSEEETT